MIGMVLVTHGRLAAEFVSALEHVVGKQEQIEAVLVAAVDDGGGGAAYPPGVRPTMRPLVVTGSAPVDSTRTASSTSSTARKT